MFLYRFVPILIYLILIVLISSATIVYNRAVSDENIKLRKENALMKKEMEILQDKCITEQGKYLLASSQIQPFKDFATKMYPARNISVSLNRLYNDLIINKFIPLDKDLASQVLSKLKEIKEEVGEENISVKITFEPWAEPDLIKFAEQVRVMMHAIGIQAVVESNNVYLFEMPVPVEWRGNTKNSELVEKFISAFKPVFVDVSNHITRISKRFPDNFIRMHIAGYMQFEPSGIVNIN